MSTDLHPEDIALLERLGSIAEIIDPVPPDVIALGKAAFALRHADTILMTLVADDLAEMALRAAPSARGMSRLHVFEHGPVSIELDVTQRGELARIIGVIADDSGESTAEAHVTLETAATSRTMEVDDDRFTFDRVPLGLARVVLARGRERIMSTPWFDIG